MKMYSAGNLFSLQVPHKCFVCIQGKLEYSKLGFIFVVESMQAKRITKSPFTVVTGIQTAALKAIPKDQITAKQTYSHFFLK